MDVLNLQPDAGDVQDKTFEVEGYKDHVEEIENAYPEEDWRTPAEIEAENQTKNQQASEMQQASDDAFKPGSVAQESPLNVAEGMPQGQPDEQLQQTQQPQQQVEEPKEPTRFTWQYDENGDIPVEQLQAAYGGKLPEGVIRKLSLTKDYLEFEDRLDELEKTDALIDNEMRTIMSDHAGFGDVLKDLNMSGYNDNRAYGNYK